MPSSDRAASRRDHPQHASAARKSGKAQPRHVSEYSQSEQPQYFDPDAPWDAAAAEALARLYESGEGYLHKRPEDRRRQPQPDTGKHRTLEAPGENQWLEARLADMAGLLQASLARLNPDKAVEQLNRRLDVIEERFNDVVERVAQRSDLEGLKLIEAHVQELATYVDETCGRLDRITAIDDQVQSVVRRLDEYDLNRLTALEKLLQDYMTEWRRSDERTASALQNLEAAVGRVGEAIEAMEVYKPASDLSLSILGEPQESLAGTDPISQVYADAARVLEPGSHRLTLNAADYTPGVTPAGEQAAVSLSSSSGEPEPGSVALPPGFAATSQTPRSETEPKAPGAAEKNLERIRGVRPNLFLTGAVTLFAALGYLLVDVFMPASLTSRPAQSRDGTPTATNKAAADPHALRGADLPIQSEAAPLPVVRTARIEAIGTAMAAALRGRERDPRSVVQTTSSITRDLELALVDDVAAPPASLSLPLAIGPASLRQAAMRGDPAAQIEVAARFAAGHGVYKSLGEALAWYGRAAAQGSAVAQYRLGAMYERGLGTPRDLERARAWYARAAEQGNVKAMHNLAVLSVSAGRSDYAAAAKWFAQAAEHGLLDSQVNLAILYQNGLGVAKDLGQAYGWLTLAARGGDAEAGARSAQVKARLSRLEVEAVDARIADWRAHPANPAANETSAPVALDGRLP